jgi:hypothetical protein
MLIDERMIENAVDLVLDELYNKQEVEEYHQLEMQRRDIVSFDYQMWNIVNINNYTIFHFEIVLFN